MDYTRDYQNVEYCLIEKGTIYRQSPNREITIHTDGTPYEPIGDGLRARVVKLGSAWGFQVKFKDTSLFGTDVKPRLGDAINALLEALTESRKRVDTLIQ